MAKKKAATALAEKEPANETQAALRDLLKELDNHGVMLVEEQWRRFSESEQNMAEAWLKSVKAGNKPILPLCLGEFASVELARELDEHLKRQKEHRRVLAPCVFGKPGFGQAADGVSTVALKIKIPDTNLGDRSALDLWGKTRCKIEFSRRAPHEWEMPASKSAEWKRLVEEGPMRIVECEADIMSFSWRDDNWSVSFLVPEDVISLDEARVDWNKQGSIRFEVIGKAKKGASADGGGEADAEDDDEEEAPVAPKAKAKKAAGPVLPGTTPVEVTFSVAVTAEYLLDLHTVQLPSGQWSGRWTGWGPTGAVESPEPLNRVSEIEAAIASLGRAHDVWEAWIQDEQAKEILTGIKLWLAALGSGRTPAAIEADAEDGDE